MATLKVADLQPAGIYRDRLSGMKVRVTCPYGEARAIGVLFNTVTGLFIPIDIRDDELEDFAEPKQHWSA